MPTDALDAFIARSPIQRRPIADAVAAFAASLPAGTRVLDAGAGDAPYRPLFVHCEHVTQDWPGSEHAGGRASAIVADLHHLPVADASFDAVLCTEVLEHVAEPERVVAELRRVLRPGAPLLVTVPFVGELHEEPHDHWRYTSHGLRGTLERGGFADVVVTPLTGYWSTLAHVLRHAALATTPPGAPARPLTRVAGSVALLVSELLRRLAGPLDRRADQRRALPIGWVATANAGTAP
ncbi:class I SAM-dependent methyltransferase [Baekduia sp. Peel2402]|uniref:class I SAM-dependent methyltransferase n=1 Tax=Baekduia sp. Peel2402 TaxID=3458296 RepID=UPI00403EAA80